VDIYLMEGMAFVDLKKGYMLCIGTKKEVDEADGQRLMQMIREAIVMSQFRSIETSKGKVVN